MSTLKANKYQHVDRTSPSIEINADGSVSIASTVTYEDVTSIDAVGVITGRSNADLQNRVNVGSGVSIKAGGLNVTAGISTLQAVTATTGTFSGNVDIADKIIHTGDTDTAIRFPSADAFTVETGGSELVRVNTTNVTIKNTAAAWNKIQRAAATDYAGIAIQESDATQRMQFGVAGGANQIVTGAAQYDVALKVYDANLILATNATERLRIASDGDVILGGSSDAGYPNYADNLTIHGTGNEGITIRSGTTSQGAIYFSDATGSGTGTYEGNIIYDHNLNALMFASNHVERLRITSTGNVGIGSLAPTGKVDIASGGNSYFKFGQDSDNPKLEIFRSTGNASNTHYGAELQLLTGDFTFSNAPGADLGSHSYTERLRIKSTGLVGINTSVPTALLSFGVKRSTQTYPPICFQADYGAGLADAAISTTDDSGGVDIMMGSNVYMGQNGTLTRYFSSYGSAAVRCGYTGNTLFYNKSGNNAPAESMRIDGSGRLLIGTAANQHSGGDLLQLAATSSTASVSLNRYTANAHPSYLNFFKSRDASLSGQTVVQDGDTLGLLAFYGSDGTDRALGAEICAQVDGTPGSDDMPGRLVFRTSADGSQTPSDRMRIQQDGQTYVGSSIGTSAIFGVGVNDDTVLSNSGGLYNSGATNFIEVNNTGDGITGKEAGIIFRARNSGAGVYAMYAARTATYLADMVWRTRSGASANTERMRLGNDGKLLVHGSFQVNNFQIVDGGWASSWDTGISVNQSNAGACLIFMNCSNWDANDSTAAGIYIVRCGYSGNQDPQVWHISGNNSWTITKSGNNTVQISNASGNQRTAIIWTT